MNLKKELGGVADAVTKIMDEALKGNQHKIDANKNNKIDAHDFKLLRSKKKVEEEAEQIDEEKHKGIFVHAEVEDGSHDDVDNVKHMHTRIAAAAKEHGGKIHSKERPTLSGGGFSIHASGPSEFHKAVHHIVKTSHPLISAQHELDEEAAGQIEEAEIVKTATGMRVYGSSYGDSAKARRDQVKKSIDTAKGPKMKDLSDIEAEKKKKKKMSEMVAIYQEQGLKGLFATLVKEEPTSAEFDAEIKMAQDKSQGNGKKAEVSKAAVQAVQSEEFEVVMDELNGYAEATIEERSMTEPEMKKKEEIVKSMKKGIAGFKERYGDRAKNVMYATATKQAMKD